MNENYVHPALPDGAADGIIKGMYKLRAVEKGALHVQLFGSGTILREVEAAADYLQAEHGISADVWSVTSYSELRREGIACDRWNTRNPDREARQPYVARCLADSTGPFIAASDYMRSIPDQIREWVPGRYQVLGTDGFGRSDSRRALRAHFEVNRDNIVVAALRALMDDGSIAADMVTKEIEKLGLDPDKPNPVDC
jgi:pyruvate dehydrogenase E1 component